MWPRGRGSGNGASALPFTPWNVGSARRYAGLSQQLTPSPVRRSRTQAPSHVHTLSHFTPLPFHTYTHRRTCSPRGHTTCTCTSIPMHLTLASRFLDTLPHTHSLHNRQHLHTQTDRQKDGAGLSGPPAEPWPGQAGYPGAPPCSQPRPYTLPSAAGSSFLGGCSA